MKITPLVMLLLCLSLTICGSEIEKFEAPTRIRYKLQRGGRSTLTAEYNKETGRYRAYIETTDGNKYREDNVDNPQQEYVDLQSRYEQTQAASLTEDEAKKQEEATHACAIL